MTQADEILKINQRKETKMTQITGAYIEGIKEGRSFLTANPDLTTCDIKNEIKTAKHLMRNHSDAMRDCFKGERDFWINQLKKRKN